MTTDYGVKFSGFYCFIGLEYTRPLEGKKKSFSLLKSRERIFLFLFFLKMDRFSTSVVSVNGTDYWASNIFFSYLACHNPC